MQTLEGLKRKIRSTEDLGSVVRTMKSLAAVSIRQYERAAESLADYSRTVEMGLQAVLRRGGGARVSGREAPARRVGAIIFGSDQGMCGALNDTIVSHARSVMDQLEIPPADRSLVVVGERARGLLDGDDAAGIDGLGVPGAVSAITSAVRELLQRIEAWGDRAAHVYLFYNRRTGAAGFTPETLALLPVDAGWLKRLRSRKWQSRSLPLFTMDPDALFSALIREYLFVSLYRALAESLASENASRLAAMQGAEQNIDARLGNLRDQFHQNRQMSITGELLDIVSGFEALESGEGDQPA